jgi:hypothetical protein
VGTQPQDASAVNQLIGQHLRAFTQSKGVINQDHAWLETVDLKEAPYYFAADQETLIKSAIADLDASLDVINMTFISRLIGLA